MASLGMRWVIDYSNMERKAKIHFFSTNHKQGRGLVRVTMAPISRDSTDSDGHRMGMAFRF
jgi:hypothetical protein